MSLEHRKKVSETKPAVWGGLPIWGWGIIALGVVLVIGGAVVVTVQRDKPMPTPLPSVGESYRRSRDGRHPVRRVHHGICR
jgi:hypothetical protein